MLRPCSVTDAENRYARRATIALRDFLIARTVLSWVWISCGSRIRRTMFLTSRNGHHRLSPLCFLSFARDSERLITDRPSRLWFTSQFLSDCFRWRSSRAELSYSFLGFWECGFSRHWTPGEPLTQYAQA